MAEQQTFGDKIENIVDTGKTIIGLILGGPAAIRTAGYFTQGVGSSIANKTVSSAVLKAGKIISATGATLQKYVSAGLKAIAKQSAPVIKGAAKSLPLSKYIAPYVKFVPYAATAYLGAAGTIKAVKTLGEIKSLKSGILDPGFSKASDRLASFNPLDLQSWIKLGKEIVTFK